MNKKPLHIHPNYYFFQKYYFRKECNIITENRGIIDLLNTRCRYYSGRK